MIFACVQKGAKRGVVVIDDDHRVWDLVVCVILCEIILAKEPRARSANTHTHIVIRHALSFEEKPHHHRREETRSSAWRWWWWWSLLRSAPISITLFLPRSAVWPLVPPHAGCHTRVDPLSIRLVYAPTPGRSWRDLQGIYSSVTPGITAAAMAMCVFHCVLSVRPQGGICFVCFVAFLRTTSWYGQHGFFIIIIIIIGRRRRNHMRNKALGVVFHLCTTLRVYSSRAKSPPRPCYNQPIMLR